MTDPFGALAMQRKGALGFFDGCQWADSFAGGHDGFGYPDSKYNLLDGTAGHPNTQNRATLKVQQSQLITSPTNALDPGYSAVILGLLESQSGNKNQGVAVAGIAQGYSDGQNYLIGVEGSGNQTMGSTGGGMGGYFIGTTHVVGGSAVGIQPSMANASGADDTTASAIVDAAYGSAIFRSPITMTSANPGVITDTGHGHAAHSGVVFSTTGALPTNVVAGTTYYILAASLTANTYRISATDGGAAIDTTAGVQSGVHSVTYYNLGAWGQRIRTDTVKGLNKGLEFTGLFQTVGIDFSTATFPTSSDQIKFLPWTAFTPTVVSEGGALGTVSAAGRYQRLGKNLALGVRITVTNAGTGSGRLLCPLPASANVAASDFIIPGKDVTDNTTVMGEVSSGTIYISKYDGTGSGALAHTFQLSGVIEIA